MESKSELKFRPGRRTLIIEAVSEIPPDKNLEGFGIKSQKRVPEEPYKFRVVAVGLPGPYDGLMIESEVQVGDIISSDEYNQNWREGTKGFLINGKLYYAIDFRDVLLIWETIN